MSPPILFKHYSSPIGELIIASYTNQLVMCDWKYRKMRNLIDKRIENALKSQLKEGNSLIIDHTIQQLSDYFEGKRTEFTIELLLIGTEFQKRVWNQLLRIPYGEIDSYIGLSIKMNQIKSVRAVATANGANAISILVPCHRIIGNSGDLVGYAGGIPAKKKFLLLENNQRFANQIQLF